MLTEFLLFVASLIAAYYLWQKYQYNYWERHGVKYVKPITLFGNCSKALTGKVPFFEQVRQIHNTPGFENEPVVGAYLLQKPILIVRDLELVKTVMIKKFNYFSDRALGTDPYGDPLGHNNLFFVRNPDWKELRTKLSPVFSSGKIKQMYALMTEIGQSLEKHLTKYKNNSVIAIKPICARFTIDIIGTIAFGVKANALHDEKSEFFCASMEMFKINIQRGIDFAIIFMLPWLASLARVKVFSNTTSDFIRKTINYVMTEREKSGIKRNDLIDILLALKREAAAHPEKPNRAREMDYLVAQAALFQTAGFETSSSTMTLSLYELAHQPDILEKLRDEINEYFGDDNEISYERIQEMPYMTQVVNETLRKYPIVGYAERKCTQPMNEEKFNLSPYANFEVPNGMNVYVSSLGIQRDERYWPEPEKFIPERFAPGNRDNLNMDAYMPFGIGPHNCIGMRLGLLQIKLGLAHLLRNHRVSVCDKTVKSIEFSALSAVVGSKNEIYLKLERV